uniref:Putative group iii salivary lipocalin n=1 Tax=Rhipicephalus pulchellus TaxID=72859 RepID=L7LT12_RHIPC
MAPFTALVFSALAAAVASLDLHELVNNPSLSQYQDPKKFISNESDVYLFRASIPADKRRNIEETDIPCVRSRYWGKTTTTVERSYDVYNKTELRNFNSRNISLTVDKRDDKTILNVYLKGDVLPVTIQPDINFGLSSEKLNRTFLVLFSDPNCLILAEKRTNRLNRAWFRCSFWLTQKRIQNPPKCCQFIFELLCAFKDDSVEFFNDKCLNKTTTPAPV